MTVNTVFIELNALSELSVLGLWRVLGLKIYHNYFIIYTRLVEQGCSICSTRMDQGVYMMYI